MTAGSAVAQGRIAAEARMVDSCVVAGPGGEPVWNDETGEYETPAGAIVYSGRCRLRMPRAAGSRTKAGDAEWAVDDGILSLPIEGSEGVRGGMTAVVTLSRDPLGTVAVNIEATHVQTDSTARRLPVKVVSRDA